MNSCTTAWGTDAYPETNSGSATQGFDAQTSLFRRQGEDSFREYEQTWLADLRQQARRSARRSIGPFHGVPAAGAPVSVTELVWLSQHAHEVEHEYRGEWLLLRGADLLSHSARFADIQQRVTELGLVTPFVYFVPEETGSDFIA